MRSSSSMWSRRPTARRSVASCGPAGSTEHRRLAKIRPALAAVVDVVEVEARLVEEAREVDVGAIPPERAQLVDLRRPARRDRFAQAAQDDLGGLLVELHVAAGGKERELQLHGALDVPAGAAEQCAVAAVEAELACGGCRRSRGRCRTPLSGDRAEAAAELLEEQGGALGRAEHQDGVDGGDVDALVEQVDREHDPHSPGGQVAQGGLALGSRAVAPDGDRRDAVAG